jgi:hypothetical protein
MDTMLKKIVSEDLFERVQNKVFEGIKKVKK